MNNSITPNWIVGFTDGDGHFRFKKDSSGYNRCAFILSQDKRSEYVLLDVQDFFKCGYVHKAGGNMMEYSVGCRKDLIDKIIPFFDAHPLKTTKDTQYLQLRLALGVASLVRQTKTASIDWLSGFIDAEGCFYVAISPHKNMSLGFCVLPKFLLGFSELSVLQQIRNLLGYGSIRQTKDGFWMYEISALSDLQTFTSLFERGPNQLRTHKLVAFTFFCEILQIMSVKGHLTEKGLKNIRELKSRMNLIAELKI